MGTLEAPQVGSPSLTEDPKVKKAVEVLNGLLDSENRIANSLRWYPPKIIATEQSRESTSFGTLGTADEIKGVVLPENGILRINYLAAVKSSVSGAGRAAIFLSSNQLKNWSGGNTEALTIGTNFVAIYSAPGGLLQETGISGLVTTGQPAGGGAAEIFAAAGTYNVSVQYRATSGSVTAKERKLWVQVLG